MAIIKNRTAKEIGASETIRGAGAPPVNTAKSADEKVSDITVEYRHTSAKSSFRRGSVGRDPKKSFTLTGSASPYTLAALAYLIFLVAWCFPPRFYTNYIDEADLMFLDPLTFAFFTSCTLCFALGAKTALIGCRPTSHMRSIRVSSPFPYLTLPILVASFACSVFLIQTASTVNIIALLASAQGDLLKQSELNTHGLSDSQDRWAITILVLTGVLWWSHFRARQVIMRASDRVTYRLVFFGACSLDAFTCLAIADRGRLIPLIAGLIMITISRSTSQRAISLAQRIFTFVAASCTILGSFLALSFLRGARQAQDLASNLLGYTLVSYNRLAALLLGQMHYQYEGRGCYLFPYMTTAKRLDSILNFTRILGWPPALEIWRSEFGSVAFAGLNDKYIWAGVFGYLYADIGWFALLYTFGVGLIAGRLWAQFRKGTAVGIILYPWIGFSILFWNGPNVLFSNALVDLFYATLILTLYDRLFVSRARIGAELLSEKQAAEEMDNVSDAFRADPER